VLFDNFVGTGNQRGRHGEAKRLGDLEIDDRIRTWSEPAREGRPVSRLLECDQCNLPRADIDRSDRTHMRLVRHAPHGRDRWQPIASGKRYDQVAVDVSHWGGGHDQNATRLTGKRCYSAFYFARATPSINWTYFDTERLCRRLDCNKLAYAAGITCFAEYGDTFHAGHYFSDNLQSFGTNAIFEMA
jgi:hypothetical protein